MLNLITRIFDFMIKTMETLIIIGNSIIKNQGIIFRIIIIVIAASALVSGSFASVEIAESLGASVRELFLDYSNFLSIAIAGISGSLAYFGFRQIITRSYSEKIDQELLSSIKLKEKQFRVQIKTVESDTEKEQLQQQILELRKGYQLLSGKILQNEDGGDVEDWRSVLLSARKRLLDEEDRLLANNTRNLGFALVIIATGIFFLMYSANFIAFAPEGIADQVSENNDEQALESFNAWDFFIYYGPIFSILVLVQIPTFFFLRLYSSNERKLERNKSDLTNIELRLTAGLMLYDKKDKTNFAILADNISKEDSNFVLGKNESSGGISTNKLLETLLKLTPTGGT